MFNGKLSVLKRLSPHQMTNSCSDREHGDVHFTLLLLPPLLHHGLLLLPLSDHGLQLLLLHHPPLQQQVLVQEYALTRPSQGQKDTNGI